MNVLNVKPKKTKNKIAVKKNSMKGTLEILDHVVERNSINQMIAWELDSTVIDGDFVDFEWTSPVPAGTFGTANIADDGNSLTISVLNNPGPSEPERRYS